MNWIIENKGKACALLVSILYLCIAFQHNAETGFKIVISLILPLACIFFGEEMGNYKGWAGFSNPLIDQTSPAFLVRFLGWVLLLLPVILGVVKALSKGVR